MFTSELSGEERLSAGRAPAEGWRDLIDTGTDTRTARTHARVGGVLSGTVAVTVYVYMHVYVCVYVYAYAYALYMWVCVCIYVGVNSSAGPD